MNVTQIGQFTYACFDAYYLTCITLDYVSSSSDIMANIFSRLDRKTNCTNARVCKAWNLPATRSIWRRSDPKIFLALGEATVNAFGTIVRLYFHFCRRTSHLYHFPSPLIIIQPLSNGRTSR